MADTGYFMPVVIALVVGITGLVYVYIRNVLKSSEEDQEVKNETVEVSRKKKSTESSSGTAQKPAKKKQPEKWNQESNKQNFSHSWLLTSLKGHSGRVLDMDFSGNGKFLATCAEDTTDDLDPGGGEGSGTSSGSEGNKENSPEPGTDKKGTGLSRRQKRNRVRRDDDSPIQRVANMKKTKAKPRRVNCAGIVEGDLRGSPHENTPPLKQHSKLNLLDFELAMYLRQYVLSPGQLFQLGYPVESAVYPGRAMIFKDHAGNMTPYSVTTTVYHTECHTMSGTSHFDVNAREFVPMSKQHAPDGYGDRTYISHLVQNNRGMNYGEIGVEWRADRRVKTEYIESYHVFDANCSDQTSSEEASSSSSQEISGSSDNNSEASGSISKTGVIFDTSASCKRPVKGQKKHEEKKWSNSEEKRCVRCRRGFFVTLDGEYLTQEKCLYHWGKMQTAFMEYTCCKGGASARGCTTGKLHVWNGINVGMNGPLDSYVQTRPRKTPPPDNNYGIYALDCEMCFTTRGLELTKVTVVGADGRLVYDCLVRPENFIIDYNTRFSGITASDLCKRGATKSLRNVQSDLLSFINANTILIGHGLENDLKALRIIHGIVIDTSVAFPHYYGLPFRRSLKSLVYTYLNRDIQKDSSGHDSFEDARACIELMLWKLRKDFPLILN